MYLVHRTFCTLHCFECLILIYNTQVKSPECKKKLLSVLGNIGKISLASSNSVECSLRLFPVGQKNVMMLKFSLLYFQIRFMM
jgi:hypothetical protein